MKINRQNLEEIILTFRDSIEKRRNDLIYHPEKDKDGDISSRLAGNLRVYAINSYALNKDKLALITHLKECVQTKESLLDRYYAGAPIDESFVDLLNYQTLFDALATGDISLAKRFAAKIDKRGISDKEGYHPLVRTLSNTLKWSVLEDNQQIQKWLPQLIQVCQHNKDSRNFMGYAEVFDGFLNKDLQKIDLGFKHILEGHKKESAKGYFQGTPDQYLCVWGIGLVNLAHFRGLNVQINDEYIPTTLLN